LKKEEGRRKKEEGGRKKEEGRKKGERGKGIFCITIFSISGFSF
jgi:hypothetical protein